VLIVGGGTAGNSLAIQLSRAGIAVDLVELKPDWNVLGSGITLQGNALRVLKHLGVWDAVHKHGFAFDELGILAPDGTVVHVQQDIRTGGDDLPATLGMQRPQLQRILIDAVRATTTNVRLGVTVKTLVQDPGGVDVTFTDGTSGRYDLVVGTDGISSATRALIGITDKPVPVGAAIWRAPTARPTGVTRTEIIYGGTSLLVGYCPTSEETIYVYLVEPKRDRADLDPAAYVDELRAAAAGYGGHWPEIVDSITDPSTINYTWMDRHLIEGDWHRGRVVLAGDAVHACPPTFAQGAAMSLEDTVVLADLLIAADSFDEALFVEYRARRLPRVTIVVDASVQIAQWQLAHDRTANVPELIGRTMKELKQTP
jgi:2-polyprenyl-6-methoxyphenol hydroxylase-like FAD-dependent oxidoreductase